MKLETIWQKTVCNVGYLGVKYIEIYKKDKELVSIMRCRWKGMLNRCYNTKSSMYYLYGGKGVTVDDRWLCFTNFFNDIILMKEWDRNKYISGHLTLDKDKYQQEFDVKIYSNKTCTLMSMKEQHKYIDYSKYKQRIKVIYPDGHFEITTGIRTFAREHGLNEKNASACANNKRSHCGGYKFIKLNK